jgi:hypothetical protein
MLAVPLRHVGAVLPPLLHVVVDDCGHADEPRCGEAREPKQMPGQGLLHGPERSRIDLSSIRPQWGGVAQRRWRSAWTPCPARPARGRSARGRPSFPPAFLLPELAAGALGAVGQRRRGSLTTEVDTPALRRLDPRAPALEAVETNRRDRACAVLLLHRLVLVETRAVSNRGRRVSTPCGSGGYCGRKSVGVVGLPVLRGGPTLECGHPRSRPMDDERRSPGRIGGPGRDAMRHPRSPRLAGSSRSQVLSETVCARPIPLRRDDRDKLLRHPLQVTWPEGGKRKMRVPQTRDVPGRSRRTSRQVRA